MCVGVQFKSVQIKTNTKHFEIKLVLTVAHKYLSVDSHATEIRMATSKDSGQVRLYSILPTVQICGFAFKLSIKSSFQIGSKLFLTNYLT